MNTARVSIIMPVYNGATYITEAIQSVIAQSYAHWQLFIIDDGSTDATAATIAQFADERIHYLYQPNQGAAAARNRGIALAESDYIAFLDADDRYRPEKLAVQVAHLDQQETVGLTYGSRVEIDQAGQPVNLMLLPPAASLETLVLRFPFAPTDLMVRRHWLTVTGGFRTGFTVNEDRDLYIRLALAGCHCVGVEPFLAYRRLDPDKHFRDLPARLDDMLRALATAFDDPRCPEAVQALRNLAYHDVYRAWAYQAALQEECALAQAYLAQALHYQPTLLADQGEALLSFWLYNATRDGGDHESRLRRVFAQLPANMATLVPHRDRVIARGYLVRGLRNLLWSRLATGEAQLAHAKRLGATLDEQFVRIFVEQLLNYERAFGATAARTAVHALLASLHQMGAHHEAQRLQGCYAVNCAFHAYRRGHYANVLVNTLDALTHQPRYLLNRGVMAISLRAIVKMLAAPLSA